MTTAANTPFSVRLDPEVKSKLKYEAQQLHQSESHIAATAIRTYLDTCEQKRSAIDEAIKQADQGVFISSESMRAWVDTWDSENCEIPASDVIIKKST